MDLDAKPTILEQFHLAALERKIYPHEVLFLDDTKTILKESAVSCARIFKDEKEYLEVAIHVLDATTVISANSDFYNAARLRQARGVEYNGGTFRRIDYSKPLPVISYIVRMPLDGEADQNEFEIVKQSIKLHKSMDHDGFARSLREDVNYRDYTLVPGYKYAYEDTYAGEGVYAAIGRRVDNLIWCHINDAINKVFPKLELIRVVNGRPYWGFDGKESASWLVMLTAPFRKFSGLDNQIKLAEFADSPPITIPAMIIHPPLPRPAVSSPEASKISRNSVPKTVPVEVDYDKMNEFWAALRRRALPADIHLALKDDYNYGLAKIAKTMEQRPDLIKSFTVHTLEANGKTYVQYVIENTGAGVIRSQIYSMEGNVSVESAKQDVVRKFWTEALTTTTLKGRETNHPIDLVRDVERVKKAIGIVSSNPKMHDNKFPPFPNYKGASKDVA